MQQLSEGYVGQAKRFSSKMQRADALVKKNVQRNSDFDMVVDQVVAVAVIPGSSVKKTPNDYMRYGVIWKNQVDAEGKVTVKYRDDIFSYETGATWERGAKWADGGDLAECEDSQAALANFQKWFMDTDEYVEKGLPFKKVNGNNDKACVVRYDLPGWQKWKFFQTEAVMKEVPQTLKAAAKAKAAREQREAVRRDAREAAAEDSESSGE